MTDQTVGRTSRRNTKSPSKVMFLLSPEGWADSKSVHILRKKLEALKRIQSDENVDIDKAYGFDMSGESIAAQPPASPDAAAEKAGVPPEMVGRIKTALAGHGRTWQDYLDTGRELQFAPSDVSEAMAKIRASVLGPLAGGTPFALEPETTPQPPAETPLQDFGQKIGGARKDLWQTRGMTFDEAKGLTTSERDVYATKANVFPTPDYAAMVEAGTPREIAWLVKKVKDSISAAPTLTREQEADPEKRQAAQLHYVEVVGKLKDRLAGVKTIGRAHV